MRSNKKSTTSKTVQIFWRIVFIGFGSFILLLLLANWGVFGKMPSIDDLENPSASLASEVIADDGTVMGKYYLEDRTNTDFKNISKHIVNALVATEDVRFYEHNGIDIRSSLGVFWHAANNETLNGVMDLLIEIRKESKAKRDFATSDKIRNQLAAIGINLKDEKGGEMSWDVN